MLADGRTTTATAEYLRESILDPAAKMVATYPPSMPGYRGQLTDAQVARPLAVPPGAQSARGRRHGDRGGRRGRRGGPGLRHVDSRRPGHAPRHARRAHGVLLLRALPGPVRRQPERVRALTPVAARTFDRPAPPTPASVAPVRHRGRERTLSPRRSGRLSVTAARGLDSIGSEATFSGWTLVSAAPGSGRAAAAHEPPCSLPRTGARLTGRERRTVGPMLGLSPPAREGPAGGTSNAQRQ